jgi:hypothetical protein
LKNLSEAAIFLSLAEELFKNSKMAFEQQKRQIAYKVKIKDIVQGRYVKDDVEPSYVLSDNQKISRVNLLATIVAKSNTGNPQSMLLDDGSGKISVRFFQEQPKASLIDIGDSVLLIGRVREYNAERYIAPEIVKKIENKAWIEVRKLELKGNELKPVVKEVTQVIKEPVKAEKAIEYEITPIDRIYELIKKLDAGSGADIDEIIQNSKEQDTEKIINGLLEKGDIFEIRKGRLKVLE